MFSTLKIKTSEVEVLLSRGYIHLYQVVTRKSDMLVIREGEIYYATKLSDGKLKDSDSNSVEFIKVTY